MAEDNELQRLAAMANALRPDWPVRSVLTALRTRHSTRAYADLAVALAWVAADPASKTPARLDEPGPWWTAVSPAGTTLVGRRMECPEHPGQRAGRCYECDKNVIPIAPKAVRDVIAARRHTLANNTSTLNRSEPTS